jgi:3-dehydrosphinganine reductase
MKHQIKITTLRVIVTGGSSGIGYEVAKQFLAMGAAVGIVARDVQRLEAVRQELSQFGPDTTIKIASIDLSRHDGDWTAIDRLVQELGGVDVLVNNAGSIVLGTFQDMTPADHMAAMMSNYHGHVAITSKLLPYLRASHRPRICFVSSVAGFLGIYGYSAYSPAKFALTGLAECLRQELQPSGISVSVAFPPDTDTPMFAYEQLHRLPETRALAGQVRPKTAAIVAARLVSGIMRGQFEIFFEHQSRMIRILKAALPWLYDFVTARIIRGAQR